MAYAASFRPHASVFDPLPMEGKANVIAQRLGDAIVLGQIDNASRLPAAAVLAEQFGVSVDTVQEALTTLAGDGLIVRRGTRVDTTWEAHAPSDNWSAADARLQRMGTHELRDLVDATLAIDTHAAMLCASRCSADEVQALRRLADVSIPYTSSLDNEIEFHLRVAILSQSPRLAVMEADLQRTVGTIVGTPEANGPWERISTAQHLDIVEAIAAADIDRVRHAVEVHIHTVFDQLFERHRRLRIEGVTP